MTSALHVSHSMRAVLLCAVAVIATEPFHLHAQSRKPATEADYYELKTIPIPEGVVLEVGGMAVMPSGAVGVSTRRGEVWIVENPYRVGGSEPHFRRFAHGLHEPLGLAYRGGDLYTAQRGELTRLSDTDGDGQADVYDTVYEWPLSGNYHEYSYGPVFRPDGTMIVALNVAWVGRGASLVPWRGWMLEITPDGRMTPLATGMRSPAGFGLTRDGDLFYAENQGDWIGSGRITHVERGDFVGNPAGLRWTGEPNSPLRLNAADIPDTGEPMHVAAETVPDMKLPAVWFPHGIMGISTSDILQDTTGGQFGPFEGQLFVGDQGHSRVMRVALEEVDGVQQGAVFPFREGFQSGVLRLAWGKDGSLLVGQTSRGWDATGKNPYGIQRLIWTGRTPFESKSIQARPDGFEVEFTLPVDRAAASDPAAYTVTSFTYKYHHTYGSPVIDQQALPVRAVVVSEDGLRARLTADGLRAGYIHEIKMPGVRSREGAPLLHDTGYYTLNRIPTGERLAASGHAQHVSNAPDSGAQNPTIRGASTSGAAQPERLTEMPASWNGRPDVTITVGTEPGLRFDVPEIQVKPGAKVRLVFNNDDDMLHNFVVVRPGTADEVGRQAMELGLDGIAMHYIPPSDNVLFHTALLQPETSESIYFIAPTAPGEYTYVCTVPGHFITMRGTLRVL